MSTLPISASQRTLLRSSRAQLSIEIMALFSFLIMLLSAIMFVSYRDKLEIIRYTDEVYARNILETIRVSINTVVIEGNGFSTEFTIPQTLNGAAYNITASGNGMYLTWSGNSQKIRVITANINGTITRGVNKIRNENGVIVLG